MTHLMNEGDTNSNPFLCVFLSIYQYPSLERIVFQKMLDLFWQMLAKIVAIVTSLLADKLKVELN